MASRERTLTSSARASSTAARKRSDGATVAAHDDAARRRPFDRLPISVAAAVLETLDAIAQNPRRFGKPLVLEHEGHFSARRGPYRVIYEVDEDELLFRVIAIGHRRDVYRSR